RHRRDASSPASPVQSRREKWLLASMVAATVSLTAAIGPGFANASLDDYHVQRWVQPLPLPEPEAVLAEPDAEGAQSPEVPDVPQWRQVEIQSGQTMGAVFSSLSLSHRQLHRLLEQPSLREPLT